MHGEDPDHSKSSKNDDAVAEEEDQPKIEFNIQEIRRADVCILRDSFLNLKQKFEKIEGSDTDIEWTIQCENLQESAATFEAGL